MPYASGAGPDFTGREIGKSLTEALGQPVVTDNRPGGGATLGHAIGAKAPPDGYTLILLTTMPHVKAGRVKLLGVGHTQRLRWMPDLPTIAETIPGYYNTGWWGLVAPAGLPKPIVDRLNPIMNKWLMAPDTLQRFQQAGLEVATTTPEEYARQIRSDLDLWRKLIKDAKISVDSLP